MKLLIVDDERMIRLGLMAMDWESVGVGEVLAAENGIEAVSVLEGEEIAVVVSDIKMPGMSGIELAEYVYRQGLKTRVILLSGYGEFEFAQQAIAYHVLDYILKPIEERVLLKAVKKAMEERKLERYREQVLLEYEERRGDYQVKRDLLHLFAGCSGTAQELLAFMADHLEEEISLQMLSERFHFSIPHISRLLRKETGYAFTSLLLAIRFTFALDLLKEANAKVSEVCEKVGIADYRYFGQVFKRTFGVTPLEYKKKVEWHQDYSVAKVLGFLEKKDEP